MAYKNGRFWEERESKDWFWIEKKAKRYFSSDLITCVDAVRIIRGKRRKPQTCHEVNDIAGFIPVPEGVLKLLTRTMEKVYEDRD
jgi:hypothetical protein